MAEETVLTLKSDALLETVAETAAQLYKRSLTNLPPDVRKAVSAALEAETGRQARMMMRIIEHAVETSDRTDLIVCQDTGIPIFFVGLGTEFAVNGHALMESLRIGIERATKRW